MGRRTAEDSGGGSRGCLGLGTPSAQRGRGLTQILGVTVGLAGVGWTEKEAGRAGTTGKGGDSSHGTQDDLMLVNCVEPESLSSFLPCGDLRGGRDAESSPRLQLPKDGRTAGELGARGCCVTLGTSLPPSGLSFPSSKGRWALTCSLWH